jgi:hypothetical protein
MRDLLIVGYNEIYNKPFIPPKLIELYLNHKEKFDENNYIRRECNIQDIFKNKI